MKLRIIACVALLATTATSTVLADGGYFGGSKGAHAAGRGGAFTAKADDVMAAMYNPAGFARQRGTSVQVGNRFSYNTHSFERQPTLDWSVLSGIPPYVEFAKVENDKRWQLLEPLLGVSSDFGLESFGFAFVVFAPPGISEQEFPLYGGQRYMMVSRKAEILNYTLNGAWKYGDTFGLGASLQAIYLRTLEYQIVIDGNPYQGRANPVEAEFDILSRVSVSDPFTLNAVLGAWYRPAPFLEIAISGQVIPTAWEAEGTLEADALNIEQDIELERSDTPADDVKLELPLPLTARLGVRYIGLDGENELFDIELDVVYETWSRVDSFTLDSNELEATLMGERIPIGVIQIEKEWQDTIGVHLGGGYALLPGQLSGRAGFFYETAVAKPEYAHVDFPSGEQIGAGLGASVYFGPVELAFGYEYRRQLEVAVTEGDGLVYQETPGSPCVAPYTDTTACHPQYLGQPGPVVNGGRYNASTHAASLDLRYSF